MCQWSRRVGLSAGDGGKRRKQNISTVEKRRKHFSVLEEKTCNVTKSKKTADELVFGSCGRKDNMLMIS